MSSVAYTADYQHAVVRIKVADGSTSEGGFMINIGLRYRPAEILPHHVDFEVEGTILVARSIDFHIHIHWGWKLTKQTLMMDTLGHFFYSSQEGPCLKKKPPILKVRATRSTFRRCCRPLKVPSIEKKNETR